MSEQPKVNMDPFDHIQEHFVQQLVVQHLHGNVSEVSPTWAAVVSNSRRLLKAFKVVVKDEESFKLLMNSTRRYQNFDLEVNVPEEDKLAVCRRFAPSIVNLLINRAKFPEPDEAEAPTATDLEFPRLVSLICEDISATLSENVLRGCRVELTRLSLKGVEVSNELLVECLKKLPKLQWLSVMNSNWRIMSHAGDFPFKLSAFKYLGTVTDEVFEQLQHFLMSQRDSLKRLHLFAYLKDSVPAPDDEHLVVMYFVLQNVEFEALITHATPLSQMSKKIFLFSVRNLMELTEFRFDDETEEAALKIKELYDELKETETTINMSMEVKKFCKCCVRPRTS